MSHTTAHYLPTGRHKFGIITLLVLAGLGHAGLAGWSWLQLDWLPYDRGYHAYVLPPLVVGGLLAVIYLTGAFWLDQYGAQRWRTWLYALLGGGVLPYLGILLAHSDKIDYSHDYWVEALTLPALAVAVLTIFGALFMFYIGRSQSLSRLVKKHLVGPANTVAQVQPITRQPDGVINLNYAYTVNIPRRTTAAMLIVTGILHAIVFALCISFPSIASAADMLVMTFWIGAITLWCFGGAVAILARILICWRLLVSLTMVAATITPFLAFCLAQDRHGCAAMGWGFIVFIPSAYIALSTLIPGAALLIFGRNK
jgi:hypothetical protein